MENGSRFGKVWKCHLKLNIYSLYDPGIPLFIVIHNNSKRETSQMSINWWMVNCFVANTYIGSSLSNDKAGTIHTQNNVDASHEWRQVTEARHKSLSVGRSCCCCYCLVALLCLTLCDPMDCSPPGSSVHGICQARILEWVAISFSRESSQPRDPTHVSCSAGRSCTAEPPGKPLSDPIYVRF